MRTEVATYTCTHTHIAVSYSTEAGCVCSCDRVQEPISTCVAMKQALRFYSACSIDWIVVTLIIMVPVVTAVGLSLL